jgi:hypothetical protein
MLNILWSHTWSHNHENLTGDLEDGGTQTWNKQKTIFQNLPEGLGKLCTLWINNQKVQTRATYADPKMCACETRQNQGLV